MRQSEEHSRPRPEGWFRGGRHPRGTPKLEERPGVPVGCSPCHGRQAGLHKKGVHLGLRVCTGGRGHPGSRWCSLRTPGPSTVVLAWCQTGQERGRWPPGPGAEGVSARLMAASSRGRRTTDPRLPGGWLSVVLLASRSPHPKALRAPRPPPGWAPGASRALSGASTTESGEGGTVTATVSWFAVKAILPFEKGTSKVAKHCLTWQKQINK